MKKTIYFKLEYYEDVFNSKNVFYKFFIKAIQMLKNIFFSIKMIEDDNKIEYICYAKNNQEEKILKKIEKIIKNNLNTKIVLSKQIKEIVKNIKNLKLLIELKQILDIIEKDNKNKQIYIDFCKNVIKDVIESKKQVTQEQTLYILIATKNYDNIQLIKELMPQYKMINIVTNNRKQFKDLEEKAEENFEPISVLNNKRKSLSNAKYILNVDFSGKEITEYWINRTSVIFNIADTKIDNLTVFDGTIINNIDLTDNGEFDLKDEYQANNKKCEEAVKSKIEQKEYELIGNRGKIFITR